MGQFYFGDNVDKWVNFKLALTAGYLLNQWNVDCSSTFQLDPNQYHLALEENAAIYGVETANLAPGYEGNSNE